MRKSPLGKRIVEILVTALVAAGLAFLQSLLTGLSGLPMPEASPEIAAAWGTALKGMLAMLPRNA